MVRRRLPEQSEVALVAVRMDPRFDLESLWPQHEAYWSREAIAARARFGKAGESFHVTDNFRIRCDGQIDGHDCGNVIGLAPIRETHDGLCENCRARGVDFPPRITMTAEGIYRMGVMEPEILPRRWQYPPQPKDADGDSMPTLEG